jgi:hypothetical protein
MNTEIWSSAAEIPDIARMALMDREGGALTAEEEFRLNAVWQRSLINAEYVFEEAPDRFPVEMWRRAFTAYGSLMRTWEGGGPGSALAAKDSFTPGFVDFIEENIIDQLP